MNYFEVVLDEFGVIDKKEQGKVATYLLKPLKEQRACQICGSKNTIFNGTEDRYVRDLPSFGKSVALLIKQHRIYCKDCESTSRQSFSSIDDKDRITKRLKEAVKEESLNYPFADVGRRYGLSPTTVKRMFGEYVKEQDYQL